MKMVRTSFGHVREDWQLSPLPEVVFFQEGPGLRKWQWTDKGMKVINVTNILGNGSVDVNNTSRYISEAEFNKKYSHFAVESGDVMVASSGNTYGKVGRVDSSHLPLMMNTSVIRFHPLNDGVRADYLYCYLRSDLFRNQIEALVTGSAQPNFGPYHLKRMQVVVPPLPTQRKIAAVLSAYDDLIENNVRRIAILEEMAAALYREWFIELRFPRSCERAHRRIGAGPRAAGLGNQDPGRFGHGRTPRCKSCASGRGHALHRVGAHPTQIHRFERMGPCRRREQRQAIFQSGRNLVLGKFAPTSTKSRLRR